MSDHALDAPLNLFLELYANIHVSQYCVAQ